MRNLDFTGTPKESKYSPQKGGGGRKKKEGGVGIKDRK